MKKDDKQKTPASKKAVLDEAAREAPVAGTLTARRSRDSSLYRDVIGKSVPNSDTSANQSSSSRNVRFVISENTEVIPVNHQAVIDGLTNTLAEIEERHQQLETLLKSKNSANKLHIAQLKGQIAALKRRKSEIESVLSASDNQLATNPSASKALEAKPKSSPKAPKG